MSSEKRRFRDSSSNFVSRTFLSVCFQLLQATADDVTTQPLDEEGRTGRRQEVEHCIRTDIDGRAHTVRTVTTDAGIPGSVMESGNINVCPDMCSKRPTIGSESLIPTGWQSDCKNTFFTATAIKNYLKICDETGSLLVWSFYGATYIDT